MPIRTNKSFKVYEQAHDGNGCGAVLESFTGAGAEDMAESAAKRLAGENPGTRYYVLVTTMAVYVDRAGELQRRDY